MAPTLSMPCATFSPPRMLKSHACQSPAWTLCWYVPVRYTPTVAISPLFTSPALVAEQDYDMANNPRHEIADKVKQVRFERYNAVWLKMVAAEEETQAETKAWAMVRVQCSAALGWVALPAPADTMHTLLVVLQGAEDSEGSASYEDDSGRWGGAMHMGHEAVAVDMDMLGYDATQWSDTGSPDGGVVGGAGAGAGAGGGAGGGAGAHDRHGGPAQWETSHPHEE